PSLPVSAPLLSASASALPGAGAAATVNATTVASDARPPRAWVTESSYEPGARRSPKSTAQASFATVALYVAAAAPESSTVTAAPVTPAPATPIGAASCAKESPATIDVTSGAAGGSGTASSTVSA